MALRFRYKTKEEGPGELSKLDTEREGAFVLVAGKWMARFADPELMWKVMALATTFAGNLTILGSVANLIVVEQARAHCEVGFGDYARYGIPVTLLTTAAGMGVLLLLG